MSMPVYSIKIKPLVALGNDNNTGKVNDAPTQGSYTRHHSRSWTIAVRYVLISKLFVGGHQVRLSSLAAPYSSTPRAIH